MGGAHAGPEPASSGSRAPRPGERLALVPQTRDMATCCASVGPWHGAPRVGAPLLPLPSGRSRHEPARGCAVSLPSPTRLLAGGCPLCPGLLFWLTVLSSRIILPCSQPAACLPPTQTPGEAGTSGGEPAPGIDYLRACPQSPITDTPSVLTGGSVSRDRGHCAPRRPLWARSTGHLPASGVWACVVARILMDTVMLLSSAGPPPRAPASRTQPCRRPAPRAPQTHGPER